MLQYTERSNRVSEDFLDQAISHLRVFCCDDQKCASPGRIYRLERQHGFHDHLNLLICHLTIVLQALVCLLALFSLFSIDSFVDYSLRLASAIDRHGKLLGYLRPQLISCPPVVQQDDQIEADIVEESHEEEDLNRDDDPCLHLNIFLSRGWPVLLPVQVE